MATQTEYLSLVKPDPSDAADVAVLNDNYDLIDAAVKNNAEGVEALNTVTAYTIDNGDFSLNSTYVTGGTVAAWKCGQFVTLNLDITVVAIGQNINRAVVTLPADTIQALGSAEMNFVGVGGGYVPVRLIWQTSQSRILLIPSAALSAGAAVKLTATWIVHE